eukprot:245188-Amorphochlora_amoeboformis.AAC.1
MLGCSVVRLFGCSISGSYQSLQAFIVWVPFQDFANHIEDIQVNHLLARYLHTHTQVVTYHKKGGRRRGIVRREA